MRTSRSFTSVNTFSVVGSTQTFGGKKKNSRYKQVIASYCAVIVSSYHFNNKK